MASTNKTTYFDLSQYTANDKPTYLVDYNTDMANIDAGIHEVDVKAGTSITNIGTLSDLTTTEKGTIVGAINEVKASTVANATNVANNTTNIGTLANLDTTTKTDLVNAINEVVYNLGLFNLTEFNSTNPTVVNATITSNNICVATNPTSSLAKIYGVLRCGSFNGAGTKTITFPTSLRPSSAFTITSAGIYTIQNTSDSFDSFPLDINVATNGNVTLDIVTYPNSVNITVQLFPCLYWVKDFGDTPTPVQP